MMSHLFSDRSAVVVVVAAVAESTVVAVLGGDCIEVVAVAVDDIVAVGDVGTEGVEGCCCWDRGKSG